MANEPAPPPAGSIQIEDNEPAAVQTTPPPAPAALAEPPAVVAQSEDAEIDLTDPELAKDQQRISGLIAELSRKRAENRDLKTTAAEVAALRDKVSKAEPYVQFLQANPQLLQPRQPEAAPEPTDDPDALEAAQLMDFYTPDGKPDAKRGAQWLALQDRRSQRQVQAHVQPIQQDTAHQRAAANYQSLVQFKDDKGQPVVDKTALDAAWRETASQPNGLQILADQRGALSVLALAIGMARLTGRVPIAPPPNAPLHTEAIGGIPKQRTPMSVASQAIAHERGWDAEKYQKLTKDYVKGRSTVLEDN